MVGDSSSRLTNRDYVTSMRLKIVSKLRNAVFDRAKSALG